MKTEQKWKIGNCLNLLPEIPDKSVKMVFTDLPYGTTQCKWDVPIDLVKLWLEYERIIKDDGVVVLTASQPFTSVLVLSNIKLFKHEWIWIKNRGSNFANTVREPMKEHESVLVFSKSGTWTYNKQMQERTGSGLERVKYDFNTVTKTENYNKFDRPSDSKGKVLRVPSSWQKINTEVGLHPNQKPVALVEYFIKTYTNEGDMVHDSCVGSGTTLEACANLNRNCICFELRTDWEQYYPKRIKADVRTLDAYNEYEPKSQTPH